MAGSSQKDRFLKTIYGTHNPDEVRDVYDRWAESYDTELIEENGYAQPRRCAEMLSRHLPDRTAAILDIGCGTGLAGAALTEFGYGIIDGCDFSAGMLAESRKTGLYRRLFGADLNAPPMDAADAAYGAAVAVGAFGFGHIHPDSLDEILRVMSPGAPLVIGLNAPFYEEGSLPAKLTALSDAGRIIRLNEEHGEHIRGTGVSGWVVAVRKAMEPL